MSGDDSICARAKCSTLVGTNSLTVPALYETKLPGLKAQQEYSPAMSQRLRGYLELVPDVLALITRLLQDPEVPWRSKWRIGIAVAYCVQPINLIPDFIPVIGLLDNVLICLWALRSTVKRIGAERVEHHWKGGDSGLAKILAGLGLTLGQTA